MEANIPRLTGQPLLGSCSYCHVSVQIKCWFFWLLKRSRIDRCVWYSSQKAISWQAEFCLWILSLFVLVPSPSIPVHSLPLALSVHREQNQAGGQEAEVLLVQPDLLWGIPRRDKLEQQCSANSSFNLNIARLELM